MGPVLVGIQNKNSKGAHAGPEADGVKFDYGSRFREMQERRCHIKAAVRYIM